MEFRQARADEILYLKQRLEESDGEIVDLDKARTWIAIDKGQIVGMLPLRMVWQAEPLLIFPECQNKITRSRATYGLFAAMQRWLGDRTQNKTGVHWFFGITRSQAVIDWSKRIGLHRIYEGAAMFVKHL